MNRWTKIVLYVLLFSVMGGGVIWVGATMSVQSQSGPSSAANPVARLDDRARIAKHGDEAAVRHLVDEVFSSISLDEIPRGMLDEVKERLLRAELSHRNGQQEAIPEINVVHAVNELATKFNAPQYARTYLYEVRKLRMATLPFLPNLVATETPEETKQDKPVGASTIKTSMSPVEAAFVTLLLLQQQISNPEYQLTHGELVSRWAQMRGDKRGASAERANAGNEIDFSARAKEMRQVMARGVSEMPAGELLNMPARTLDALGIQ
ncbi:MAG TPA: hypothetical protein VNO70_18235 [Blastocatellia bacterium]|nr:hypothetical protein [Blastocatellia bacterium]